MATVAEAQEILRALGLPLAQQNEMAAYTLLALCGLMPGDPWSATRRDAKTVTKGIMDFVRDRHGKLYAPNTRETFRRQVLHQFVQARIADYNPFEPDLPTNSPRAHYALTEAAMAAITGYGTAAWSGAVEAFRAKVGTLIEVYARRRQDNLVPVTLPDGSTITLSPGKHNQLQAAIIEQFGPRFAPGSCLLYLGDTVQKDLFKDTQGLQAIGVPITEHDKLPDVVLYSPEKQWVYLIEAVTSHGPMSPKRVFELEAMFKSCSAGTIFVSAFPDMAEFRKFMRDIAWETEVWIAEVPEHMIHYNGDRFMGPRTRMAG